MPTTMVRTAMLGSASVAAATRALAAPPHGSQRASKMVSNLARPSRLTGVPSWRSTSDIRGSGVAGLKSFIKDNRQDNFVDNISRKLLAYALGRSLQLSDEALIEKMKTNLAANGYRFRSLVETIVLSPQFRDQRVATVTAAAPARPALNKINFQKEKP